MSESDLVLFERWRHERDAEAFAELVSRYADMVYATCRRVTGDAVAAEDVTQECFLRLAEGRAQVHRSVAGWLHSLATCRSLDRLRGEARRRRLEERFAGEVREPVAIDWEDLQPHIDAAIEDLPERLREVVVRHFLHGETHAEVAARLGVSRPAVSKSIARGVERIRAFLRRRGIAVSAVMLAGLAAERAVEAAPESVRISLGKLALSGVPEGTSIAATAGISLTAKVVTIVGSIALLMAAYVALLAWPAQVSPPPVFETAVPTSVVPPAIAPPPPAPVAAPPRTAGAPVSAIMTSAQDAEPEPATVGGMVRSYDLRPLAGAMVEVSGINRIPTLKRKILTATTNEDGIYEISGIDTTGTMAVAVRVSASGHSDTVQGIELAAGEVQDHMDFDLRPGTTLVGQVLTSEGAPVPSAMVMPWSIHCNWNMERLIDEGGDFAISCDANGRFKLGAFQDDSTESQIDSLDIVAPGYGAAHFSEVKLSVGEVVPFRLQSPCTIQGRVQWNDGSPAVGYAVQTQGMYSAADHSAGFTARRGGAIRADGSFQIADLPPKLSYNVWVQRIDGPMLPNTRTQTQFLQPGVVFEWNPVLSQPTRVTGGIHVQGTVEPFGHYSARAIKEGSRFATAIDYNEDGGDYELLFKEPGSYWIYPEYEPVDFSEADTLKGYGRRVELKAGDNVRVDLNAPKPYIFPVRVLDAQGRPFVKAELRLCWCASPGDKDSRTTTERKLDSEGRFTWFCRPGPEVWFTAAAKGFYPESTAPRIALANVSASEEVLVLEPAAGLKARIVLPEGVNLKGGVDLRITYSDGRTEDLLRAMHFCGSSAVHLIPNCIRAGTIAVMAFEADVDEPHMSQIVECTVAPGEIYDLGDLVMR